MVDGTYHPAPSGEGGEPRGRAEVVTTYGWNLTVFTSIGG